MKTIWEEIKEGKNIDIYIAIIVGISLSILGILSVIKYEIIAAVILLVLSFLLYELLSNRRLFSEIKSSIENITSDELILKMADFPDPIIAPKLKSAREIMIVGTSLFRFLAVFQSEIENALNNGASMKIIFADPDSSAINMASFRSSSGTPVHEERQRIISTIKLLRRLSTNIPKGKIEIRSFDYISPYSILIINSSDSKEKAYCQARLFPFRETSMKAPIIIADPNSKRHWFEYFYNQFSKMWEASTIVSKDFND